MRLLKRKMCVKDTPSSDQYGHTDVKQHLMATFTAIGHVSVPMKTQKIRPRLQ